MVATVTGQFLGIQEIPIKDKPALKMAQLLQQGKKGDFSIVNIPISDGFSAPKANEKITVAVTVSAFISKRDNSAKVGLRME